MNTGRMGLIGPAAGLLVVLGGGVRTAGAQEVTPSSTSVVRESPPLDVAPRPWLYLDDPTLPAPMHVVAFTRATYTNDPDPTRPFGANLSRPGGLVEAGGEVGLLPKLSLAASGFGGSDTFGFGALAGLRFDPLQGTTLGKTTHIVLSGGYLHELNGGDGAWLRFGVAQDIQRLRLGATVHGEHIFAAGRDAVDLLVMAGASYQVAGPFRAGVEYVAQDLEAAADDDQDAEGGVRQFIGPHVGLELLDNRLSLGAGPAFGIGPSSPRVTGRLAVAYEY
jgi:hypothetical protein